MKKIAIIPARMGSSRYPGKPLAPIHGLPMIAHVYHRVNMSEKLDGVFVATCDEEIQAYCDKIGAPCVMTSKEHERCSDRTAEAMLKIEKELDCKIEVCVMVQGDEPMVTPSMIDAALGGMQGGIQIVNLMAKIKTIKEFEDPNEVKVVVNLKNEALYFSREPVPSRKKGHDEVPMCKQVCIIPFQRDYLLKFNQLKPTPLEEIESVDMMRVLEHGEKVQMVETFDESYSVDTPEDLLNTERAMEGDELMPLYLK